MSQLYRHSASKRIVEIVGYLDGKLNIPRYKVVGNRGGILFTGPAHEVCKDWCIRQGYRPISYRGTSNFMVN